jgi:hypothetical protein
MMKKFLATMLIAIFPATAYTADIVWRHQDDSVSVTTVVVGTPEGEAARLKRVGAIPDSSQASFRLSIPPTRVRRNEWKWTGDVIEEPRNQGVGLRVR